MPARFALLARVIEEHYGLVTSEPKRGSHWKVANSDGLSFRITAHNGLKSEIPDFYLDGLCRRFGIDKAELRRRLRGED